MSAVTVRERSIPYRVFLRSCQLDNTLPQTFRLRTCYLVETHTVIYSFWTQNFGLLPIFVLDTFCTPPCHIGSTCTLCRPVEACGAQFGASCTAGVSPYTRCGELGPGSRILEILSGHGLAGGRCTGARWALRRVRGGCVGTHLETVLDDDHDTLSVLETLEHAHIDSTSFERQHAGPSPSRPRPTTNAIGAGRRHATVSSEASAPHLCAAVTKVRRLS